MAANPAVQRSGRDRRLYTWFAILMPFIVLLGFARTYYLKGFFETPAIPGLLVHLHGAVMTSWVILFVVQVWLVSSRRVKVHQRLGKIGALLALLVFVVGVMTGIASAARGATPGPPPGYSTGRHAYVCGPDRNSTVLPAPDAHSQTPDAGRGDKPANTSDCSNSAQLHHKRWSTRFFWTDRFAFSRVHRD